jgi:hypothetical protein
VIDAIHGYHVRNKQGDAPVSTLALIADYAPSVDGEFVASERYRTASSGAVATALSFRTSMHCLQRL